MDVQTDEWMEEPHLEAHARRVHSVHLMPWIYPQTRRSIRKRHTSLKHGETPGAWTLSAAALGFSLVVFSGVAHPDATYRYPRVCATNERICNLKNAGPSAVGVIVGIGHWTL
jgi:hypothetical protein